MGATMPVMLWALGFGVKGVGCTVLLRDNFQICPCNTTYVHSPKGRTKPQIETQNTNRSFHFVVSP